MSMSFKRLCSILIVAALTVSCASTRLHHEGMKLIESGSYEEGLERLKDIQFGDVPSPAADIQVARGKKSRTTTKTGSPTPLADVGAESGEGASASSPADAKDDAEDEEGAGTF